MELKERLLNPATQPQIPMQHVQGLATFLDI